MYSMLYCTCNVAVVRSYKDDTVVTVKGIRSRIPVNLQLIAGFQCVTTHVIKKSSTFVQKYLKKDTYARWEGFEIIFLRSTKIVWLYPIWEHSRQKVLWVINRIDACGTELMRT